MKKETRKPDEQWRDCSTGFGAACAVNATGPGCLPELFPAPLRNSLLNFFNISHLSFRGSLFQESSAQFCRELPRSPFRRQ